MDVNAKSPVRIRSVIFASQMEHPLPVLTDLISCAVLLQEADTPLIYAARHGRTEIVRMLVDHPNINILATDMVSVNFFIIWIVYLF